LSVKQYTLNDKQSNKVYLSPNPVREGYTFDGWYFDKDTWQQKFTEGTHATADLTLYAKWI